MRELKADVFRAENFAQLLDVAPGAFSEKIQQMILGSDYGYEKVDPQECSKILREILIQIEANQFSKAGEERKPVWEAGWSENLNHFTKTNFSLEALVPKFFKPNPIIRLNGGYIRPNIPMFHVNVIRAIRQWLFEKYLEDFDFIYEFGCGTGYNLAMLAQLYPEKKIIGLDWVNASVQLINILGRSQDWKIEGALFDFFSPNKNLKIEKNSAVITISALEQIGSRYEPFLNFILEKSPALCINIETLFELYDENNPVDAVAMKYHAKRGYLNGYLSRLKELEALKQIVIYKTQKVQLGDYYHDGSSFVIWKPIS